MFVTWIIQHWFDAVQTGGIVASLLFARLSLRDTHEAQKIANLFSLTQYQRELYGLLFAHPELHRVFRDDIDLTRHPVTDDERLFLTFIILHADLALQALRTKAVVPLEGLTLDLAALFSKPIPRAVWKEMRPFQNRALARIIDDLVGPSA